MEKFLTGPNLMFLGVMLWAAIMLKQSAVRSRQSRNRDVAKELQTELRTRQRSVEGQFHQLEVRLHDFDRDVSARITTTMAMLDQLIVEADQEILRLETLLEERLPACDDVLPAEQRRMVAHLAGAGYSIQEIARLIGRPVEVVAKAFPEDQDPKQAAA